MNRPDPPPLFGSPTSDVMRKGAEPSNLDLGGAGIIRAAWWILYRKVARLRQSRLSAYGLGIALVAFLSYAAVPTGPNVGESVPEFRLQDQNGAAQTLRSILGPKGALLVFYRSADW
jgi:hypothetical protein